jgi:hypothetical protein
VDITAEADHGPLRELSRRGRALAPPRVLAALLVLAFSAAFAPSALAAPSGGVSGTVTDATTHEPIEGVEACAYSMNESQEEELEGNYGCAKSGSHGEYDITGLQPGKFAVGFGAQAFAVLFEPSTNPLNYVFQYYEDKYPPSEPTSVTVNAGSTTTGIDAALQPGSEISGTITNASTGAPAQSAFACAVKIAGGVPTEVVACAASGASGEYTIAGLPDGEFGVVFLGAKLVAQYYPDKASAAEAGVVTISAAKETKTGIDAAMLPMPVSPITGTEPGAPGSPGTELPGGPLTGPLTAPKLAVSLATPRIDVHHGALALVRLACAGTSNCQGKLVLSFKRTVRRRGNKLTQILPLGSVRYSLRHDSTATVTIRLDLTGRGLLRAARGSLAVRLAITQRTATASRIELNKVLLVDRKSAVKP